MQLHMWYDLFVRERGVYWSVYVARLSRLSHVVCTSCSRRFHHSCKEVYCLVQLRRSGSSFSDLRRVNRAPSPTRAV